MDMLASELTLEQIPEGIWRSIAEEIGVEALVKLCEVVGGSTIYLPRPESITRPARDARIREEFNGYNQRELAKRYQLTERYVRQLCGTDNPEGQLALNGYGFDGPPPVEE